MNTNEIVIDKCRLCLADCDNGDVMPIFDYQDDSGLSLAAIIMVCLSIPIKPRDSLPLNVCKSCGYRVSQFYAFREICYDSYYSLLGRRLSTDADEFCENVEDNEKNLKVRAQNNESRLGSERIEESQTYYEQDIPESVDDNHPPETYEITAPAIWADATAAENLQSSGESYETSTNSQLPSEIITACCDTDNNETNQADFNKEDVHSNTEEDRDIRYKCLCCDGIFPDLESASVHSAGCLPPEEECAEKKNDDSMTPQADPSMNQNEVTAQCPEDTASQEIDQKPSENFEERSTNSINQSKNLNLCHNETQTTSQKKSPPITSKTKPAAKNFSYKCPNCDSSFSSPALLKRHTVVHTGERPFECPTCKKRFSQIGQLNFHKNFHANPRYRCQICEKPFLRPSDIDKHMRTHTGEKPYACDTCSKSFAQLVALQQHERIHTGVKPYVCEICGKKFSQKANKTKHVKIHKEGAKPHTCEFCGRSFSDVREMNLHRAGHGGGKPRRCNYCDDSFKKPSELEQHVRRCHTFERPHKCAFCQKAFYSLYHLKQHVMVHTGQKPWSCTVCNVKFTQKGNLTKHVERKHNNTDNNIVDSEEERKASILILTNDLEDNTTDPNDSNQLKYHENHEHQKHSNVNADYTFDGNNKFVVVETSENADEATSMMTNDLSNDDRNLHKVEIVDNNDDLQIYNINE